MSKAPLSAGEERVTVEEVTVEELDPRRHQEEMATAAVERGVKRSFLPLKRKPLPHGNEELSEYCHGPKRFVSEELMAARLQHLKLSSEGSAWRSSVPPAEGHRPLISCQAENLAPYPCHLSIKTVASCPKSVESQVSRKRAFPDTFCSLDAEDLDQDISDSETEAWTPADIKKTRMDLDCTTEAHIAECARFKSDSRVVHAAARPEHQRDSSLAPLHGGSSGGGGNTSDLSSIPEEEGEPSTRQSLTSTGKNDSHLETTGTSVSGIDSSTDEAVSIPKSIPTSLPQSLLESDDAVCSVWLAPELKAIKTHADFPLPLSILKEIDSRGMEVVPWVGGLHTLLQDKGEQRTQDPSSSATEDDPSMEMN